MKIDVPYGEVADRVSILLLKERHLVAPDARANVRRHRDLVEASWSAEGLPPMDLLAEWPRLCAVNAALWEVEDALRRFEREGRFDEAFIEAARSVYRLNDERAALKRSIDRGLGSALVEEKSHGG